MRIIKFPSRSKSIGYESENIQNGKNHDISQVNFHQVMKAEDSKS